MSNFRLTMAVMKVVIITIIAWACHLVAAKEKTCSAFCSSLGMLQSNPGNSCNDIYQINKASRGVLSGNYWINTTTGEHQVYCDMELECGGHKGGLLILIPAGEMIVPQDDGLRLLQMIMCRSTIH